MDAKFCEGRFVFINAWQNITTDPVEKNHLAVCDATSLVALDENLASDLFMPRGFQLETVWSRWMQCFSPDSWTRTPCSLGMTFHTAFVDPIARPGAPERESIECRAFPFFHETIEM